MNDVRTVAELEKALKNSPPELLQPARLSQIRVQGRRRRRARLAVAAGSAAAAVVLASLAVVGLTGGGQQARDSNTAATSPRELSPLAKRALQEVPGARQVSSWQVLLPMPVDATENGLSDERVPEQLIDAGPVDVGARRYTGVTSFEPGAFPDWLYDGVDDYEKHVLGTEQQRPVGSTETGILVDAGPMDLGCMRPLPEWTGEERVDGCFPAMLGQADGHRTYAWGMGTESFLKPGKGLELFSTATYVSGSAATVWIGGTHGTDVASVDLVTTDGTTVPATVASGTLVPGNTMFWGTVRGELARAVTRDADGTVLEDHALKPCDTPVECEVR